MQVKVTVGPGQHHQRHHNDRGVYQYEGLVISRSLSPLAAAGLHTSRFYFHIKSYFNAKH